MGSQPGGRALQSHLREPVKLSVKVETSLRSSFEVWRKPLELQYYAIYELGVTGAIFAMHTNQKRCTIRDVFRITQQ